MADVKITALTAISSNPVNPATFPIPMVDLLDNTITASGTTKKVTVNQILGAGGTATLASATITGAATVGTTLGVTGASTFAAGTALLPALTTTGDTNTGIYYPAADTFAVTTGGTERYRVDSAGNVGIGVSPSAWTGGVKALDMGSGGLGLFSNGGITVNAFFDSTDSRWEYKTNGPATFYNLQTGVHQWFVAAAGVANNPITTFAAAAMTLDASGRLLVGKTSGVNKIETVGAGIDGSGNVNVSTVATTIYAIKQVNTPAMCVVSGDDGSSGFCDIVLFLSANAPKVVSSQTMYGTPPARTYTASSSNLQLALASGTQNIRTAVLSTLTA